MKMNRGTSGVVILSLLSAALVLGSLFFANHSANAQAAGATATVSTVSTVTVQVSGTAPSLKTGLTEAITFSGPLVVTTTVMTDPAMGPSVAVYIDGRGVKGTGSQTGTVYVNECEANLSRPFGATDSIKTTFAFFEDKPGAYLKAKTAMVALNLTYDTATMKVTKATGSVSTL